MSDIPIPPEAVEALREELRMSRLCADPATARAAIRAVIAAWPDATMYGPHSSGHGPSRPQLVLPLPQEARDENHLRPDRRTNVAERLFGDE